MINKLVRTFDYLIQVKKVTNKTKNGGIIQ